MNDIIRYGPKITPAELRQSVDEMRSILIGVSTQASALADEAESFRKKYAFEQARNVELARENEGLRRELALLRELAGA